MSLAHRRHWIHLDTTSLSTPASSALLLYISSHIGGRLVWVSTCESTCLHVGFSIQSYFRRTNYIGLVGFYLAGKEKSRFLL